MILETGVQSGSDEDDQEDCQKSAPEANRRKEQISDGGASRAGYDDNRRAETCAGGYAERIGGSEWILKDRLDHGSAYRQCTADQKGTESPRDPDLPQNGNKRSIDGVFDCSAGKLRQKDGYGVRDSDVHAPETDPQDQCCQRSKAGSTDLQHSFPVL